MSRMPTHFERLQAQGRKALIPFITAGDPDAALTVPLMHALVEAGADVIELGVPFSDPMADGPTIQRASEAGAGTHEESARTGGRLPANRGDAGRADGLRQSDRGHGRRGVLPPQRAGRRGWRAGGGLPAGGIRFRPAVKAQQLDPIFLLAPTSTEERIAGVAGSPAAMSGHVS